MLFLGKGTKGLGIWEFHQFLTKKLDWNANRPNSHQAHPSSQLKILGEILPSDPQDLPDTRRNFRNFPDSKENLHTLMILQDHPNNPTLAVFSKHSWNPGSLGGKNLSLISIKT